MPKDTATVNSGEVAGLMLMSPPSQKYLDLITIDQLQRDLALVRALPRMVWQHSSETSNGPKAL